MRAIYSVVAFLSTCYCIVLATTSNQSRIEGAFLPWHNRVRSEFSVQSLNWSTILASKAQTWASGCRFEHSNGQLGPYGENTAAGTGSFIDRNAMNMFMEGLNDFNPTNPAFSDFTQIIWRSTTKLGCGSAQCDGIFDAALGKATMYVCLYEPVGNVVGVLEDNVGIL